MAENQVSLLLLMRLDNPIFQHVDDYKQDKVPPSSLVFFLTHLYGFIIWKSSSVIDVLRKLPQVDRASCQSSIPLIEYALLILFQFV